MNWDKRIAKLQKAPKDSPNLGWTPRWADLRPHPEQLRLWNSSARFKIVLAGRRSGKTELAKRRLAAHALAFQTEHDQPARYFAAAPTREQAKRIYWDDLKALAPHDCVASIAEAELKITMRNGNQIQVLGLDVPQRIEGSPWDGAIIDELANCRPGVWDCHIRPSLADREGWAWLIGVPDMNAPGQMEYESLAQLAQSHTDPEWNWFHWPSADILPPEEIESARRRLDPKIFAQEYLGQFIVASGRAFTEFNPQIHVKDTPYDPTLPICWSLDFNINPMCSGVLQHDGRKIKIIDELTLPNTSTLEACEVFLERAAEKDWNLTDLHIYGDATGSARDSTSGVSDWYLINNRLKLLSPKFRIPRTNPPIKDSINALRARLCNANHQNRLVIDPHCTRIIDDLRNALWPSTLDTQHALAWLRYFIAYEYPVKIDHAASLGTVGISR